MTAPTYCPRCGPIVAEVSKGHDDSDWYYCPHCGGWLIDVSQVFTPPLPPSRQQELDEARAILADFEGTQRERIDYLWGELRVHGKCDWGHAEHLVMELEEMEAKDG